MCDLWQPGGCHFLLYYISLNPQLNIFCEKKLHKKYLMI